MQSSLFDSSNFLPSSSPVKLSSKISIRPAIIDDINQLGEVLTLSFNNFNDLTLWIYPFVKLGVCEDLRSRLKKDDPDHFCLVAVNNIVFNSETKTQILGTVELSFRKNYNWQGIKKYAYIANLAVNKSYRRQGIGSQLLTKCEEIAQNHGFNEIYLHVLANNKSGQELYLYQGYSVRQVETDLYSLFVPSKRRLLLMKTI